MNAPVKDIKVNRSLDGPWNSRAKSLMSWFGSVFSDGNTKHDFYGDFGWPEFLRFEDYYRMFTRMGIAQAAIEKTIGKTWETNPALYEAPTTDGKRPDETPIEEAIRKRFSALRVWQVLMEADRRAMVGQYAGVILRIGDGKMFDQPVTGPVIGGLEALRELIPAWQGQLTVAEYGSDPMSDSYGKPVMYTFNEVGLFGTEATGRQFKVHPDRVILWSADTTINARSSLAPGFNALITLQKVSGAGGEGFWKNAKSGLIFEVDKDARLTNLAAPGGGKAPTIGDDMNEAAEAYNLGFDKAIVAQGMTVKTTPVTLPSPEHFYAAPLQEFAASFSIPLKILIGSQSGERASTEDSGEWAKTCMSRRENQTRPNAMMLVNRLVTFGILDQGDWSLEWADLTDATPDQKLDRAAKMADINAKTPSEWVFIPEEIRAEVGKEPLDESDKVLDDGLDDGTDPLAQDDPANA
jgi:hypothetical protein